MHVRAKPLSPEPCPAALAKAERYRLLNEPGEAESICLDVLAVEPDNQEAPHHAAARADRSVRRRRGAAPQARASVLAGLTRRLRARATTPASSPSGARKRSSRAPAPRRRRRLRMAARGDAALRARRSAPPARQRRRPAALERVRAVHAASPAARRVGRRAPRDRDAGVGLTSAIPSAATAR